GGGNHCAWAAGRLGFRIRVQAGPYERPPRAGDRGRLPDDLLPPFVHQLEPDPRSRDARWRRRRPGPGSCARRTSSQSRKAEGVRRKAEGVVLPALRLPPSALRSGSGMHDDGEPTEDGTVDILYLVDRLEELVGVGKRVPFSGRVMVEEEQFLDLV